MYIPELLKQTKGKLSVSFRSLKEQFRLVGGENFCAMCGFNLDDYTKSVEALQSEAWSEGFCQANLDLKKAALFNSFTLGFNEGVEWAKNNPY